MARVTSPDPASVSPAALADPVRATDLIAALRPLLPQAGHLIDELAACAAGRADAVGAELAVTRGVSRALDRKLLETSLLADLARRMFASATVEAVARQALALVADDFGVARGVLAVRRVATGEPTLYFADGHTVAAPNEAESLLGRCLGGRGLVRAGDHPGCPLLPPPVPPAWGAADEALYLGRDLSAGRLALGVALDAPAQRVGLVDRLQTLLRIVAPAVDAALAHEEACRRAITDPLTGLVNRAHYDDVMKRDLDRAKRYGTPLALAVLDLNCFKQINDRLGHEVGDMVLREFAGLLRANARPEDTVCRFGGDEFVVVMPGLDADRALAAMRELGERVAGSALRNFGASASYGVAAYPADGRIPRVLYTRADRRMYEHKAQSDRTLALATKL